MKMPKNTNFHRTLLDTSKYYYKPFFEWKLFFRYDRNNYGKKMLFDNGETPSFPH